MKPENVVVTDAMIDAGWTAALETWPWLKDAWRTMSGGLTLPEEPMIAAYIAMHAASLEPSPAASEPAAQTDGDETGWVIVRDLPFQLGYWDGVHFDTDNLKAIRFSRQLDADRYLKLMHGGSEHPDRVEEHRWCGPSTQPPTAAFNESMREIRQTLRGDPPAQPVGNTTIGDDVLGLYKKYDVRRVNDPTGKHEKCEYYVLDLVHDKFSANALEAYARACERGFPKLAYDLFLKAGTVRLLHNHHE